MSEKTKAWRTLSETERKRRSIRSHLENALIRNGKHGQ